MKTALLVCDHVADSLVEEFGNYVDMFHALLPELEMDAFFVVDYFFPDIQEYDAFIITGSKRSVYEKEPWIVHLLQFIRELDQAKKKLVGICFGHQAIAEALGGKVEPARPGYLIGVHEFAITNQKPWMRPASDSYQLLMLCQDQVSRLPENSQVLAKSGQCPVAMYVANDRLLGIQGHPEFPKAYNRAVFENRLRKVSPDKVELAIHSLEKDPDRELIRSWVLGFLSN